MGKRVAHKEIFESTIVNNYPGLSRVVWFVYQKKSAHELGRFLAGHDLLYLTLLEHRIQNAVKLPPPMLRDGGASAGSGRGLKALFQCERDRVKFCVHVFGEYFLEYRCKLCEYVFYFVWYGAV